MSAKDRRIYELKRMIPEVDPIEAFALQQRGAALIDVREADEIARASPNGAYRLGRGYLELKIEEVVPDYNQTVLLMCAGGIRSLFAAEGVMALGYKDVRSVRGGFNVWRASGLPVETPHDLRAL